MRSYDPYADDFPGSDSPQRRPRRQDDSPREAGRPELPLPPPAAAGGEKPTGKVLGPAILLILTGVVNLGFAALFGFTAYNSTQMSDAEKKQARQMSKEAMQKLNLPVPPDDQMEAEENRAAVMHGVMSVGTLVESIVILLGALMMLRFRMYGLAMAASVASFLSPGCCCVLGLAGGIWGMIALSQDPVKKAFE